MKLTEELLMPFARRPVSILGCPGAGPGRGRGCDRRRCPPRLLRIQRDLHVVLDPLPAEPRLAEPMPPSDADLIAASRTGDPAAYATLYERHAAAARGDLLARAARPARDADQPGRDFPPGRRGHDRGLCRPGHPGAARHPGVPGLCQRDRAGRAGRRRGLERRWVAWRRQRGRSGLDSGRGDRRQRRAVRAGDRRRCTW